MRRDRDRGSGGGLRQYPKTVKVAARLSYLLGALDGEDVLPDLRCTLANVLG